MGKQVKRMKRIIKKCAGFLTAVMVILAGVWTAAVPAEAASGNVYTCAVHPCYVHPVTGVIEDSGGEASYATGQGMVDGVVYPTGILELTDSGEYYLTVRFSLMDQTSGHSFWVQNVGDSGWSAPAAGVTGSGTDGNGTTADICIQVPSENCVVRVSMYVDPMGRDEVGRPYMRHGVKANYFALGLHGIHHDPFNSALEGLVTAGGAVEEHI